MELRHSVLFKGKYAVFYFCLAEKVIGVFLRLLNRDAVIVSEFAAQAIPLTHAFLHIYKYSTCRFVDNNALAGGAIYADTGSALTIFE